MQRNASVLLIDDGELDDVRELLDALGVPVTRLRGGAVATELASPRDVIVATLARVDAVELPPARDAEPLRVAVMDENTSAAVARQRAAHFDYLVRRPVHPEALRLLMLHCVYRGKDQRDEPRTPVGCEVSFDAGTVARRAILADLSTGGCRLLTPYLLREGHSIRVDVPEALHSGEPIGLVGRVAHAHFEPRLDAEGLYSVGVRFDGVSRDARRALEWILEEHSRGPSRLERSPGVPVDVRLAQPRPEASADEETSALERRAEARRAYDRPVPVLAGPGEPVLGRDLSAGGMRIEPLPGLAQHDRLHLAIQGGPREEPLLVWATVARDDGERGLGLVFDGLEPPARAQLERILGRLPQVESPGAADAARYPSRILDTTTR